MKFFLGLVFIYTALFSRPLYSANLLPAPLLTLEDFFTHHVLVAEKSTHLLHLFKNTNGKPELVKSYLMTTGKKTGDKSSEGDFKTPEGIFNFTQFMNHQELVAKNGDQGNIYGAGAFVTNYPNPVDQRMGKTGSGIWLHSTNDESRIEKGLDSRGCVVTGNKDLIEISNNIELFKTPIIVVQDLVYLNENTHEANKNEIKKVVDNWLAAWKEKNIEAYMSHYHPFEFIDSKGNYSRYKAYKKAVFTNPGKPTIELNNLSILQNKNYAIVTFTQKYQSNTVNDTGKKQLYLKQDTNYEWKIVSEVWSKDGIENLGRDHFEASMRFFK